jgi:hypothetical protein
MRQISEARAGKASRLAIPAVASLLAGVVTWTILSALDLERHRAEYGVLCAENDRLAQRLTLLAHERTELELRLARLDERRRELAASP